MTKVAVLIDGGFFLKRLTSIRRDIDATNAEAVEKVIGDLVHNHLKALHHSHGGATENGLLYRCFYYDAEPYDKKGHRPISKKSIDFSRTNTANFRRSLFDRLRRHPNFAVRLGEIIVERQWIISEQAQKSILDGSRDVDSLSDEDFNPGFRQKAVDMRLGLDIASITLKGQADTLVLVTGDSDFVPAAKLARREGVRIILDPLWLTVRPSLYEHIDILRNAMPHIPTVSTVDTP